MLLAFAVKVSPSKVVKWRFVDAQDLEVELEMSNRASEGSLGTAWDEL